VDADVEPGRPHGLARAGEPLHVAELAEDRRRGQLADPVLADQRLAARLAAGEPAQLALQRRQLGLDRLDQPQRDRDPLLRRLRQSEPGEEGAPLPAEQPLRYLAGGDAVLEERRPDPLQPLGSLLDQRPAQAGARAPLADVRRRQPGLGQPPLAQELAQVAGVGPVGLGAPLLAAPGARLGRLGQVRERARRRQLLADEQPAGAGLERDLDLLPGKALAPGAHGGTVRVDPAAAELARLGVQSVEGDLGSVHVESGYDRHQGLL
jgi:hypothetical protein